MGRVVVLGMPLRIARVGAKVADQIDRRNLPQVVQHHMIVGDFAFNARNKFAHFEPRRCVPNLID